MKDNMIEQILHDMRLVVVNLSDKQLVKAYVQSDPVAKVEMSSDIIGFDFVYLALQRELAERHPRRWKRFVQSGDSVNQLCKYYLKG